MTRRQNSLYKKDENGLGIQSNKNHLIHKSKRYSDDSLKHSISKQSPNVSGTTRPFSFLSNLGGKEIIAPSLPSQISMPDRLQHKIPKDVANELRQSKITIFTDANVDRHEYDIEERRIMRRKMMNITSRGLEPPPTEKKRFRPSSSKPNLKIQNLATVQKPGVVQNQPMNTHEKFAFSIQKQRRRPMSANPKFVTISGRNR